MQMCLKLQLKGGKMDDSFFFKIIDFAGLISIQFIFSRLNYLSLLQRALEDYTPINTEATTSPFYYRF
jgi:hypothetical protein